MAVTILLVINTNWISADIGRIPAELKNLSRNMNSTIKIVKDWIKIVNKTEKISDQKCGPDRLCNDQEGHCKSDDDCNKGLECGHENCNKSKFPSKPDGESMNCCTTKLDTSHQLTIGFIIALLVLVFLLSFILYRLVIYKRQSSSKILELRNSLVLSQNELDPLKDIKGQISSIQINLKREIPMSSFEVIEHLGSGQFGSVHKGELKEKYQTRKVKTVAIKSVQHGNEENIENFLKEIKIMGYLDHHLNLVSMIGSCTLDFETHRQMFLVLEYCKYGDLKNFLLEYKEKILNGMDSDVLNFQSLVLWTYDISNGMQFLEKNQIMHGDLAARNVLLHHDPSQKGHSVAKVADFGLSKNFYDNVEYKKESRLLVPWKWMAIEYLTCNVLTLKSDVWSFAVVLWEIFSLGKVPYGQQDFDEVLEKLERGYRLPCPSIINGSLTIHQQLYESLSKLCFVEDPNSRPSFCDITSLIGMKLSKEELSRYNEITKEYQSHYVENYLKLNRK